MILTILIAGVLGGSAYFLWSRFLADPAPAPAATPPTNVHWGLKLLASVVVGVAAAFVVPVFLSAISSDLVKTILATDSDPPNATADNGDDTESVSSSRPTLISLPEWYVFFGFCVLAAYGAPRFLATMLERTLKQLEGKVNEVERAAQNASNVAEGAKTAAEGAKTTAEGAKETAEGAKDAAVGARQIAEGTAEALIEPSASLEALSLESRQADFSAEEIHVLETMKSLPDSHRWPYRSADGIAAVAQQSPEDVEVALHALERRGLVRALRVGAAVGWQLTPAGIAWKKPQ